MSSFTLYHAPTACSKVSMNALEACNLDYNLSVLNMMVGDQRSPEYLAVNPKGKVPALLVDNQLLTENVAIISFLNLMHPEANLLPTPKSDFERAQQISDLTWCSAGLHPMVRQVRMPSRYTDGDTTGVKAKGEDYFTETISQINDRLQQSKWWYGDMWSIVDVYIYWCYFTSTLGSFDLSPYPAVEKHAKNIRAQASYQRAFSREMDALAAAGLEWPKNVPQI